MHQDSDFTLRSPLTLSAAPHLILPASDKEKFWLCLFVVLCLCMQRLPIWLCLFVLCLLVHITYDLSTIVLFHPLRITMLRALDHRADICLRYSDVRSMLAFARGRSVGLKGLSRSPEYLIEFGKSGQWHTQRVPSPLLQPTPRANNPGPDPAFHSLCIWGFHKLRPQRFGIFAPSPHPSCRHLAHPCIHVTSLTSSAFP